jgi:hypothetical protein
MGQLARERRHAAGSGGKCAHHEIRISISVVWGRSNATECFDYSTAVAASFEEKKRGIDCVQQTYYYYR